jgi:signal transduction histidine kinase
MKRVRDTLRQSIAQGSQDVAVLASEVAARQRQLEQAASENARLYQEAQTALRMREEFFAIAAHELKTPLTTLLGTAHLMLRRAEQDGDLAERYRRATASIAEQSDRLSALVEQFLDLSRIERGLFVVERAPLDLAALLRQLSELVQPTLEHHRLELGGEPSLTVQGDALRLEEVFQQLISNAVKYSPDGGSIALRLERRESWAAVIVRDQGIGIPSESLGRLFERFYRAPNTEAHFIRGLGIGLYMAQNIVAMHGGSIEVASAEGQGSAFTVLLPLAADSPPR